MCFNLSLKLVNSFGLLLRWDWGQNITITTKKVWKFCPGRNHFLGNFAVTKSFSSRKDSENRSTSGGIRNQEKFPELSSMSRSASFSTLLDPSRAISKEFKHCWKQNYCQMHQINYFLWRDAIFQMKLKELLNIFLINYEFKFNLKHVKLNQQKYKILFYQTFQWIVNIFFQNIVILKSYLFKL